MGRSLRDDGSLMDSRISKECIDTTSAIKLRSQARSHHEVVLTFGNVTKLKAAVVGNIGPLDRRPNRAQVMKFDLNRGEIRRFIAGEFSRDAVRLAAGGGGKDGNHYQYGQIHVSHVCPPVFVFEKMFLERRAGPLLARGEKK